MLQGLVSSLFPFLSHLCVLPQSFITLKLSANSYNVKLRSPQIREFRGMSCTHCANCYFPKKHQLGPLSLFPDKSKTAFPKATGGNLVLTAQLFHVLCNTWKTCNGLHCCSASRKFHAWTREGEEEKKNRKRKILKNERTGVGLAKYYFWILH